MSENSNDDDLRPVPDSGDGNVESARPSEPPSAPLSEPPPPSRRSDRPPGSPSIVSALSSAPPIPPSDSSGGGSEPMRPMRRIKLGHSEAPSSPSSAPTSAPASVPPPSSGPPRPAMSSNPALSVDGADTGPMSAPAPVSAPPRAKMDSQPASDQEPMRPAPSIPPPRPHMASSPVIETTEANFEELEEELTEEELAEEDLSDLTLTPRGHDVEPVESEEESIPASVEPDEELEASPAPPPVAPPPPHVAEELSADDITPEPASAEDFEVPPAERKPPPPRRSAKPSLPQAAKPRNKPWWETLFGDDFSRAYRAMTPSQLKREVDFIVDSFGLPRGSVILDLGCGQGEICVELARRGYSVVGYDLSVYQLAMAGDNAQTARQKINFLQGDMREMAFDNMFDGVLCWDTTFGYFEDDKNADVLQRILQSLKPGGRFVLDVMNRDFAAQQSPYSHWFEGDGCVCMDDMTMDWITNRMRVKRSIILDDGRSKELQYSVRLYGLYDVGRIMNEVGFRVTGVSGDVATRGAFFGPNSRRMIIEASKP